MLMDGSCLRRKPLPPTGFGHAQLGGLAVMLADVIKKHTGAKVRGIELSLLQRCASHAASKTDVEEAWQAWLRCC